MKPFRSSSILLLLIFILLSVGCSTPDTSPKSQSNSPLNYRDATVFPSWYNPDTTDTLKIVTWNIEHFVDDYDNPYIDNSREDDPDDAMEQRRILLAHALRKLDADIVVFQELENDSYLRDFADKHLNEMGYHVFAALESPDWYMNVVMMSRVPMGLFHSYAHINTPVPGHTDDEGRPASQTFINNRMWTADLLVNSNYTVTITGLHLKAGRGDRNEAWRTGQVQLLRSHLQSIIQNDPGRNMIVMGDLNATPGSPEFELLLGESAPVFVDPLAGTGIFSHPSDSAFWRIDHILPNREAANELIPNSVAVARPLDNRKLQQISDHLPLKAQFITKEQ